MIPLEEQQQNVLGALHESGYAADLAKVNLVVVACPPGELRVIDRRPQPCPECDGTGDDHRTFKVHCQACGGRGTVDVDRIHGLDEVSIYQAFASMGQGTSGPPYVKYVYGDTMHPTYESERWQPDGWETPLFRLADPGGEA